MTCRATAPSNRQGRSRRACWAAPAKRCGLRSAGHSTCHPRVSYTSHPKAPSRRGAPPAPPLADPAPASPKSTTTPSGQRKGRELPTACGYPRTLHHAIATLPAPSRRLAPRRALEHATARATDKPDLDALAWAAPAKRSGLRSAGHGTCHPLRQRCLKPQKPPRETLGMAARADPAPLRSKATTTPSREPEGPRPPNREPMSGTFDAAAGAGPAVHPRCTRNKTCS
jgi:hypothetical protein